MKVSFLIALRDEALPVSVEATLKVPKGFELINLGQRRGDPKYNDGQGSFLWELSLVRASDISASRGRQYADPKPESGGTNLRHLVPGLPRGGGVSASGTSVGADPAQGDVTLSARPSEEGDRS